MNPRDCIPLGENRLRVILTLPGARPQTGYCCGMLNADWIEHRRGRDGERLGWISPQDDGFVAHDLLGRRVTDPVDWLSAEETLDALGIGYLADRYELQRGEGEWLRVRITEVLPDAITVSEDHGGAIGAAQVDYSLALPISTNLRPRSATD